jgi:hypothetical protein
LGHNFTLSFRGDSALPLNGPSQLASPWRRYALRGDTLAVEGQEPALASFSRDTLVLTGISGPHEEGRFTRRRAPAGAPRPDRIALSAKGAWPFTPTFSFEVDSSGTVHLYRPADPPPVEEPVVEVVPGWSLRGDVRRPAPLPTTEMPDLLAGRSGSYVGTGHQALFVYLSELATTLRADTAEVEYTEYDGYDLSLVLWYDGRAQVHYGPPSGYGDLFLLLSEVFRTARDVPVERTSARYQFEPF